MNGYEVQIIGQDFEEARRDLLNLEAKLKESAVRAGLVRAIAPTKRVAKALAPKDKGHMARAIGHRTISKTAKTRLGIASDQVALLIGANRRVNGRYQGRKGLWHEYGTEHMEPSPFLLPALEQTQGGFAGRFYDGLANYLDRKGLRA